MPAPKNIMPPDKGIMAEQPVTNRNELVTVCNRLTSGRSFSWPHEIDRQVGFGMFPGIFSRLFVCFELVLHLHTVFPAALCKLPASYGWFVRFLHRPLIFGQSPGKTFTFSAKRLLFAHSHTFRLLWYTMVHNGSLFVHFRLTPPQILHDTNLIQTAYIIVQHGTR